MNTQAPTVTDLLNNYAAVLIANLDAAKTIEEKDLYRLELQAVMHHLRNSN